MLMRTPASLTSALSRIFFSKKLLLLIPLFAVWIMFTPGVADAACGVDPGCWAGQIFTYLITLPLRVFMAGISLIIAVFAMLAGFIFFLIGGVLGSFISQTLSVPLLPGGAGTPGVVTEGWNITRDLVNLLFAVILVFIGLATILRLQTYRLQQTLPRLILMALLVNFSGVFVAVVVDLANLIINVFLSPIGNFSLGNLQALAWDIPANYFLNSLSGLFTTLGDPATILGIVLGTILYGLSILVFYFVGTFILLGIFLVFLLRVIVLWILTILAPIAFAAYILPSTRRYFNQWLQALITWAIVGIPILFFMLLTQLIFVNIGSNAYIGPSIDISDPGLINFDGTSEQVQFDTAIGGLTIFIANTFPWFVGLVMLGLGLIISLQMAPASAQAVGNFGRKAAVVTTGFLARDLIRKRLAESNRTRDSIQKTATTKNPTWGTDQKTGEAKGGIFAWAQRRAAVTTGWTTRGIGQVGENVVIKPEQQKAQQAARKAAGQDVHQNMSDLEQAGSLDEKLEIAKTIIARKQLRDATNEDVMGKGRILTPDMAAKLYGRALENRDSDTTEALERGFITNQSVMQRFAEMTDRDTGRLNYKKEDGTTDQNKVYEDKTGITVREKDPETGEERERFIAGVTQEEYDGGIESFEDKVIAGTTSADEIGQLRRGWHRKKDENGNQYLMEAANKFWRGAQWQQAATRFGRSVVSELEGWSQRKIGEDPDFYFKPTRNGAKRDAEGNVLKDRSGNTLYDYTPNNPGTPLWAAGNAGQALGIAPMAGAETTNAVNIRRQLSTAWSSHYEELEPQYESLTHMIRAVQERRNLEAAGAAPEEIRKKEVLIRDRWDQIKTDVFATAAGAADEAEAESIRNVWFQTQALLRGNPDAMMAQAFPRGGRNRGGNNNSRGGRNPLDDDDEDEDDDDTWSPNSGGGGNNNNGPGRGGGTRNRRGAPKIVVPSGAKRYSTRTQPRNRNNNLPNNSSSPTNNAPSTPNGGASTTPPRPANRQPQRQTQPQPRTPATIKSIEEGEEKLEALRPELESFRKELESETNPEAIENWQQAIQSHEEDIASIEAQVQARISAQLDQPESQNLTEGRGSEVAPPPKNRTRRRTTPRSPQTQTPQNTPQTTPASHQVPSGYEPLLQTFESIEQGGVPFTGVPGHVREYLVQDRGYKRNQIPRDPREAIELARNEWSNDTVNNPDASS